jgi:hypothetical protein
VRRRSLLVTGLGHQTDAHRVQRRLGPALHPELAQQVADVGLDRALAEC